MEPNEVQHLYEEYLINLGEESRNTRGYKHFHPSAFGDCIRKIALQYYSESIDSLKQVEPVDPKLQRAFEAGHAFHFRMQKSFAKMGILRGWWKSKITGKIYGTENPHGILMPKSLDEIGEKQHDDDKRDIFELLEYEEIKVENKEFNFKGHVDGILEINGELYVIDFKTTNEDQYSMLTTAHSKYIVQINIYMWLLNIRNGIIYYEEKNRHQLKEFHLRYNEKLIDDIKDRASQLVKVLERKALPKIPQHFSKDKKPCRWCEFANSVCYKK